MAKAAAKTDTKRAQDTGPADPVSDAVEPEKVEVLDIPANEPYPTGKGRDPEADFEAAHGFKRAKG